MISAGVFADRAPHTFNIFDPSVDISRLRNCVSGLAEFRRRCRSCSYHVKQVSSPRTGQYLADGYDVTVGIIGLIRLARRVSAVR